MGRNLWDPSAKSASRGHIPQRHALHENENESTVAAHINISKNHPLFHLSKICASSGTKIHSCCSLSFNESINKINLDESNNSEKFTESWVNSGGKSMTFTHNPSKQIITNFNKCSLLPLIEAQVGNHTLCAIIDCGASRSLISTIMAMKLWGNSYKSKIKPFQIPLCDVNNKILATNGTLDIEITTINGFNFHQNFIVYQSNCTELLLGFNFIKKTCNCNIS